MASLVKIWCVTPDGVDEDHRIDFIGGKNADGSRWKISIDKAIAGIHAGTWEFYTEVNGNRASVVVRQHPQSKRRYLTTLPDSSKANNLCNLVLCPV